MLDADTRMKGADPLIELAEAGSSICAIAVLVIALPLQSCYRGGNALAPTDVAVGSTIAGTVSSAPTGRDTRDAYRLHVDRNGALRASLDWRNSNVPIRLELWNGSVGNGACCAPVETAEVPVEAGDEVVIGVAATGLGDRVQQFQLTTSLVPPLSHGARPHVTAGKRVP